MGDRDPHHLVVERRILDRPPGGVALHLEVSHLLLGALLRNGDPNDGLAGAGRDVLHLNGPAQIEVAGQRLVRLGGEWDRERRASGERHGKAERHGFPPRVIAAKRSDRPGGELG